MMPQINLKKIILITSISFFTNLNATQAHTCKKMLGVSKAELKSPVQKLSNIISGYEILASSLLASYLNNNEFKGFLTFDSNEIPENMRGAVLERLRHDIVLTVQSGVRVDGVDLRAFIKKGMHKRRHEVNPKTMRGIWGDRESGLTLYDFLSQNLDSIFENSKTIQFQSKSLRAVRGTLSLSSFLTGLTLVGGYGAFAYFTWQGFSESSGLIFYAIRYESLAGLVAMSAAGGALSRAVRDRKKSIPIYDLTGYDHDLGEEGRLDFAERLLEYNENSEFKAN